MKRMFNNISNSNGSNSDNNDDDDKEEEDNNDDVYNNDDGDEDNDYDDNRVDGDSNCGKVTSLASSDGDRLTGSLERRLSETD